MSSSDDEVDESNLPSAAECEERCQNFAEVTGTDTALAMFYLQEREWNLERSLDAFFSQNPGSGDSKQKGSEAAKSIEAREASPVEDPHPNRVRILSWNIDGLDPANVKQRAKAVVETIKEEKPEVVFLQEVVGVNEAVLREGLPGYLMVTGGEATSDGYYTAVLLHRPFTKLEDFTTQQFFSSQMGRNLLTVNCTVKKVGMALMTSHLESTGAHTEERKRQLGISFKAMAEAAPDRTVVFGGDLNLRDKELQQLGGLPEDISDLWEATGSRKEARYTWDTFRNDNLGTEGRWRARHRFDRLYLRSPRYGETRFPPLKPVYFELVGIARLPNIHRFPSDHWGIMTHFDLHLGPKSSGSKEKAAQPARDAFSVLAQGAKAQGGKAKNREQNSSSDSPKKFPGSGQTLGSSKDSPSAAKRPKD